MKFALHQAKLHDLVYREELLSGLYDTKEKAEKAKLYYANKLFYRWISSLTDDKFEENLYIRTNMNLCEDSITIMVIQEPE